VWLADSSLALGGVLPLRRPLRQRCSRPVAGGRRVSDVRAVPVPRADPTYPSSLFCSAKKYFPVHAITPDLNAGPATPPAALPPPSHLATRHSLRLATRSLLARRGDWLGLSAASPAAPVTPPASPSGYLGAALRSSPHAVGANPVFVSSGHRVGLGTALELVLACCAEARVPEPIRQADLIGELGGIEGALPCEEEGRFSLLMAVGFGWTAGRAEVKRLWG